MKKILHKLRVWLLGVLGGVPREWIDAVFSAAVESCVERGKTIRAYQAAVREICRRSESSCYDWCCDYCIGSTDCKRNGWREFHAKRSRQMH